MQLHKSFKEIEFDGSVSKLTPIKSNAGWYAGRIELQYDYDHEGNSIYNGLYFPYSRESSYFRTPEEVEKLIHYWGNDVLPSL